MDSKILRNKRENFWLKNNHKYLPEVSLVANKESTAMFNVAGMQQIIPYLAGKKHPLGGRLFNIQKCIRTNDIDEVGDASHLTFFEMMGNWSLGDYFKKESVKRSYEFLVEELGFDAKKLAVTVFEGNQDAPRDEETFKYWKEIGIAEDKISFLGVEDNRRSPGPVGPCGPDTEIFYRVGKSEYPPKESNIKDDDNNWMEIRNNVFMEYYRDDSGRLTKLKNQNVDTGMGFERMCTVLQKKESVFDTDIFRPIIDAIQKYIGLSYKGNERRFRIIADHIRTASILINDGVVQSNIGAGYVLRMIIRRMYYNLMLLKDLSDQDLVGLISESVNFTATIREIKINEVIKSMLDEINTFKNTISRGLKVLHEKIDSSKGLLSGSNIFFLYDTCGFPLELTREICTEKHVKIDEDGFKKELESQKERSRQSAKFQKDIDRSKHLEGISQTEFIGYAESTLDCHSEGTTEYSVGYEESKLLKDFEVNGQRVLIFDKTPFYAESGGQKGDSGIVELDTGEIVKIKDVQKYEGVFLHFIE